MNIRSKLYLAVAGVCAPMVIANAQSKFDLAPPNEAILSQAEGIFRVPPNAMISAKLFPSITVDPYQEGFERMTTYGIGLSYNIDDNGYRDQDDIIENSMLAITPYVRYQSKLNGEHPYQLNAAATYITNDEVSEDDMTRYALSGGVTVNPASSFRVGLEAGASRQVMARGQAGARVEYDEQQEPEDQFDHQFIKGQVTVGQDRDRLQGAVYVRFSDNDFINNDRDLADNDRLEVGLAGFYGIDDVSVLSLEFITGEIDYYNGGDLDSETDTIQLGYAWEPSDQVALNIHVGNAEREYTELDVDTGSVFEYGGSLSYQASERSRYSIYAAQTIDDADQITTGVGVKDAYFEASLIGLSASTSITDRIDIGGSINAQSADYRLGRSDTTTDIGAYLGYLVTESTTIGVTVGHTERDSNAEDADFENDYFGVYLRSQFTQ